MNQGWIKLHRELLDKPIWLLSSAQQKVVLITLMAMANHADKKWEWRGKPYICKPGQMITSLESIQKRCGKGLSRQNIRTALKRFETYGFLTRQLSSQNQLITICDWDTYQRAEDDTNIEANTRLTHDRHTPNTRLTANKNEKNEKNKKNVRSLFIVDSSSMNKEQRAHNPLRRDDYGQQAGQNSGTSEPFIR
jgi:hypothetical protein